MDGRLDWCVQGRDAELPCCQLGNGETFAARLAGILLDSIGAWNHVGGNLIRLQCQAVGALGALVSCEVKGLAFALFGHNFDFISSGCEDTIRKKAAPVNIAVIDTVALTLFGQACIITQTMIENAMIYDVLKCLALCNFT